MPVELLRFPPEVFKHIIHDLVNESGIIEAWKLRITSRAFAAEIHNDVLAQQPLEVLAPLLNHTKHRMVIQENLGLYLYNCVMKRIPDGHPLFARLRELLDFLASHLNIEGYKHRESCARRLCTVLAQANTSRMLLTLGDTKLEAHISLNLQVPANMGDFMNAAVAVGAEDLILKLLQDTSCLGRYCSVFHTPLETAIHGDNNGITITLIDSYEDILRKDGTLLDSALHVAMSTKKINVLQHLLEKGYDDSTHGYKVLLGKSIISGAIPEIDTLLQVELSNKRFRRSLTEIFLICRFGTHSVVSHYIKEGKIDANGVYRNSTPLMLAADENCLASVKAIVEAGADVNKTIGKNGKCALRIAARNMHYDMIHYLLQHGASPDTSAWNPKGKAKQRLGWILKIGGGKQESAING